MMYFPKKWGHKYEIVASFQFLRIVGNQEQNRFVDESSSNAIRK